MINRYMIARRQKINDDAIDSMRYAINEWSKISDRYRPNHMIFDELQYHIPSSMGVPSKYIINKGATVLIWEDGTKTIVKRSEDDEYDKIKGFLWAYFQKHSGLSKNKANEYLKSLVDEDEKKAIKLITSGKVYDTLANVSDAMSNAFKNMADTFRKNTEDFIKEDIEKRG